MLYNLYIRRRSDNIYPQTHNSIFAIKLEDLLGKIEDELKLRNYSRKTIKSHLPYLSDCFWYAKIYERLKFIQK